MLFALGEARREELFEVIEESKGLILAALTLERGHGPADRPALARVRDLLARSTTRACYLTLLADQDQTYAVVVERAGGLRAAQLAIGRVQLAAVMTTEVAEQMPACYRRHAESGRGLCPGPAARDDRREVEDLEGEK